MKTATMVATVLAIIVALGLGWYLISSDSFVVPNIQTPSNTEGVTAGMPVPGTQTPETEVIQTAPMGATVIYTAQGFSPSSVTIAKGATVTFVNESGGPMWVASGPHPAHTGYSGTERTAHCPDTAGVAFDQCAVGDSYTFTFERAGTWPYHDHVNASKFGKVIVE